MKAYYKGVEVLIETRDDLEKLVEWQAVGNGHRRVAATPPAPPPVADNSVRAFVASLPNDQKSALRLLYENGGSMPRQELMRGLNVANAMSLSGRITTPMQRKANNEGFNLARVLVRVDADGDQAFSIPPESMGQVGEGLEM